MQNRFKYVLYSIGLAIVAAILLFLFFYPSTSSLGKFFTVSIIYIYIVYTFLFLGAATLVLRFFSVRISDKFFYTAIGTFNIMIGLLTSYLYFINAVELQWLNKSLMNLFLGFIMLVDSLILSSWKKSERSS